MSPELGTLFRACRAIARVQSLWGPKDGGPRFLARSRMGSARSRGGSPSPSHVVLSVTQLISSRPARDPHCQSAENTVSCDVRYRYPPRLASIHPVASLFQNPCMSTCVLQAKDSPRGFPLLHTRAEPGNGAQRLSSSERSEAESAPAARVAPPSVFPAKHTQRLHIRPPQL